MSSSRNKATSKADDEAAFLLSDATPARILAWGSTTGKLYLDDSRLDDSESRGEVWNFFMRKAGGGGNSKGGSKMNTDDGGK